VRSAQALQQAAACQAPGHRPRGGAKRGRRWPAAAGRAKSNGAAARIALEWAASAEGDADAILAPLRPSAWVLLRAGGADLLSEALLHESAARGIPALVLDADPPADAPFLLSLNGEPPAEALCADAEAEAQAACAQVLAELEASSDATVALIAQDREGVRRVRALLERFAVPVIDDTGWRLATTRAAARLVALLRTAQGLRPGRTDAGRAGPAARLAEGRSGRLAQPETLIRLEALWARPARRRSRGRARPSLVGRGRAASRAFAGRAAPLLARLARVPAALCLSDPAEAARWRDDAAGRAVLLALRMEAPASQAEEWLALARQTTMGLDDFVAWVDEVLADASFVPPHDSTARVVITPLARAMLRPFDAVVFPGTDERRLGAAEPQPELIAPALAQSLGLEGAARLREREMLAFAQLLRQPRVTLLRRAAEGDEAVGASPLVERLRRAWAPRALPRVTPQLPTRTIVAVPDKPPLPQAGERWPEALSASAVEALRACPYRFFSRVLLGLGEADELDRMLAKRDYGNWLHAVLWRFHSGRTADQGLEADRTALRRAAADEQAESQHSEADLLPFLASFEALVEPYLAWLHLREAEGWHWWQGELDRRSRPSAGRPRAARPARPARSRPGGALHLLDYKTGSCRSCRTLARPQRGHPAGLLCRAGGR
jgi:ATP-dependent helicase/nuclease subunit B